ncbi:MAG: hypothetical protein ACREHG_09100 [Candidatus Saccharimonadales bacterium]
MENIRNESAPAGAPDDKLGRLIADGMASLERDDALRQLAKTEQFVGGPAVAPAESPSHNTGRLDKIVEFIKGILD